MLPTSVEKIASSSGPLSSPPVDVAEVAAAGASSGVDRHRSGELAHVRTPGEATDRVMRGGLIRDQDVADPTRLAASVAIAVADVVGADLVPGHGHVRRHRLDQAAHGRWRQLAVRARVRRRGRGDDPRGLRLVKQDRLADELLDDPATDPWGHLSSVGRQVSATRAATDIRHPPVESRQRDRPAADDGHDGRVVDHGQPLTPPTVMPSTKNRWAKMNTSTIGRTTRHDAAISRLYATSCSLV